MGVKSAVSCVCLLYLRCYDTVHFCFFFGDNNLCINALQYVTECVFIV